MEQLWSITKVQVQHTTWLASLLQLALLWRAQARGLRMGRMSGPQACADCDRKDRKGWTESFWGGEIQTHLSNLDTTESYANIRNTIQGHPYGLQILEAKKISRPDILRHRHTKSTHQRITSTQKSSRKISKRNPDWSDYLDGQAINWNDWPIQYD